ncbi:hypothetical protein CYLTODRAFT_357230 [Cylindrobasidium torrendii FP15055 ss-10]|uniref:U3 small nucleolar RNA-associated protein 10 n=1 Tax=Cylindrobasidium torrendii FP15055 ss-10 TaxID=1314674 RepID=A0A0D7B6P4_9AGAR|nr:hypothetical protein CYLTODRAFT_357230 [Cylindrobasidium torrendii FP15055 ss-10]
MSSLAAQLTAGASLNSALLVDRSRRKPTESYLFTGRDADTHDLDSIYALGTNGLLQLASVDPKFQSFEKPLFSSASRDTDRTLLPKAASQELDKTIAKFLGKLGPYLMEAPAGKVLEWLVRRYRVNEFNVEAVLTLFLPHHESPHFAKMVTILHIKPNTSWSFLIPFKQAAQNVPRTALVKEMGKNIELVRFVSELLPTALKAGLSYRTLVAFHAGALHDYFASVKTLSEGVAAIVLPSLVEPLHKQKEVSTDTILASYILLATLSHKVELTPAAMKAILKTMTLAADRVSAKHYLGSLVSVCEPQDELQHLSSEEVERIVSVPGFVDELPSVLGLVGIEKVLEPMVNALVENIDKEDHFKVLEALFTSPRAPKSTLASTSTLLLPLALEQSPRAHRLLHHVQQRHPIALHTAADQVASGDEDLKESVDQLIMSLAMVLFQSPVSSISGEEDIDMAVAATSADAKVRAIAAKALISKLAEDGNSDVSTACTVRRQYLTRFCTLDADIAVLEAVYEKPAVVLPVFLAHSPEYLNNIAGLVSSKVKGQVLRLHLAFLITHFAPQAGWKDVYRKVLFPLMLYSKTRQHTVDAAWAAIPATAGFQLLNGCAALWKKHSELDVTQFNGIMAAKIADNMIASNDFAAHVDDLVEEVRDRNVYIRILACLIGRSLLRRLTGKHQISTAVKLVQALDGELLEQTEGMGDIKECLEDERIEKSIVSKPNSKHTAYWVQLSLLTIAAEVPPAPNVIVNWLIESPLEPTSPDSRASEYVSLMRTVYTIANKCTTSSMMHTLRALFGTLGDDALAFLTGLWLTADSPEFAAVALAHYAALLEAFGGGSVAMDFQTVIPALLVAIQSPVLAIRQLALRCLNLVNEGSKKTLDRVYAFDAIYGAGGEGQGLVYLMQDDLTKYLMALVERTEHFVHDGAYIVEWHREYLAAVKGEKKKSIEHKHNVVQWLSSHVNASGPACRVALLRSISKVAHASKASFVAPSASSIAILPLEKAQSLYRADLHDFVSLLAATYDQAAAHDLNANKDDTWIVYKDFLAYLLQNELHAARKLAVQNLEQGLFALLSPERQLELCALLLDLASQNSEHVTSTKLLVSVLGEPSLIIRLLKALQPDASDVPPASKRPRTTAEASDGNLPRLSVLAEVLAGVNIPGSFDVIVALVHALNNVIQQSMSSEIPDVAFIEQSLMTAISNTAEKVTEMPNLSPGAIRLDVLVDLIRTANNPQTFQQVLLLMATLARLSPDSVLHNILPIFTFMGSNVFHRDDMYSFTVVQKTVDNIVPVMVASLRDANKGKMELLMASREFLRVFTDAANHIPRHRRTNFFIHLVNVLGANDFLLPIVLLLVEKVASKAVRQSDKDARSTFALPISILQHYASDLQNAVLCDMIHESQRLAIKVVDPSNEAPTLLDDGLNEEHATNKPTLLKRRSQGILLFAGLGVSTGSASGEASPLISLLVGISTHPGEGIDDVRKAGQTALEKTLRVMPAADYLAASTNMVHAPEEVLQIGALQLLSERLPQVSDTVRQSANADVVKVIERVNVAVSSRPGSPLAVAGLKCVRVIGGSMKTKEEPALAELVPVVLSSVRARKATGDALLALGALVGGLGPRVIPFFKEIVSQSIGVLEEGLDDLAVGAIGVLRGLIQSVPAFWATAELSKVISLYIVHRRKDAALAAIVKAATKQVPPKVVIPTLVSMWSGQIKLDVSAESRGEFFEIVRRALRTSPKAIVQENLRALFNVFLEALDIMKPETDADVVVAFTELVVNINENTFRPLFRKLYDWAFVSGDDSRKISFCLVFSALLDYFKALMTTYTSFVLQEFITFWKSASAAPSGVINISLWNATLNTMSRSLSHDDGVFWQDEKVKQVASPIVLQIPVAAQMQNADAAALLRDTLSALVENASDDTLLKTTNLELLMHTRSEEVQVRLFALGCATVIWQTHGGKMLAFAAETATFIAECSEDENDMVCRAALDLKEAVEGIAGSIQGL